MREWLESIAGPTYATAMMWTLGALLLLLVVLLLIKIVRNLTFGTFVSGGRNRKARLAVMDAAAVDSHRRLVLVRRDDVEHLILIGGPTDVVVEQNIRLAQTMRRADEPARDQPAEERPRTAAPAAVPPPVAAAQPVREVAPQPVREAAPVQAAREPAPARPIAEQPVARPTPQPPVARFPAVSQPAPAPAPVPRPAPPPAATLPPQPPIAAMPRPASPAAPVAPPPPVAERPPIQSSRVADDQEELIPDLDEALREELEITLEERKPRREDDLPESVEDEMSKLLGELSGNRR